MPGGGGVWQDGFVSDEAVLRGRLEARRIGVEHADKLLKLLGLWRFYARSMNLLGPAELGDALLDHVDEALAAVELAQCGLGGPAGWLDVGSGAGLPSLVVAAVCPATALELVEPRAKRVSFLRMALGALGRGDVRVWCGRVEDGVYLGEGAGPRLGGYGVLSARAVFEPAVWLEQAAPWCANRGRVLLDLPDTGASVEFERPGFVADGELSAGRWRVAAMRLCPVGG